MNSRAGDEKLRKAGPGGTAALASLPVEERRVREWEVMRADAKRKKVTRGSDGWLRGTGEGEGEDFADLESREEGEDVGEDFRTAGVSRDR